MGARHWALAWVIAAMAGHVHASLGEWPTCDALREVVKEAAIEKKVSLTDAARAALSLDGSDQKMFAALLHLCGIGVAQDLSQGLALLEKEISSGNRGAAGIIALAYMNGELGLPKDARKGKRMFTQLLDNQPVDGVFVQPGDIAKHRAHFPDIAATEDAWLLKAAFNGDRTALADRALAEYDAGRYETALPLLRVAAASGDFRAYDRLIWMYQTGTGVPVDLNEVFVWAQRALDQRFPDAYQRMFELIARHQGGEMAARLWLQRLVDAKDANAQNLMGEHYFLGRYGLTQDWNRSETLWKAAAAGGSMAAIGNLERQNDLKRWWAGKDLELDQIRNKTSTNDPKAYLDLARLSRSNKEKTAAYLRAWNLGSETAPVELGSMLVYSNNSDKDRPEGLRIMHEAAAQGNKKAMAWLSRNYAEGGFVVQDLSLAYALNFLAYAESPDSADELARYQASLPVTLTAAQLAQGRRLATELRQPGRFAPVLQTHLAR